MDRARLRERYDELKAEATLLAGDLLDIPRRALILHNMYLDSGRNHTFFRAVIAPSPERLARMNALLEELTALAMAPDPDPGPLVCLSWIAAPVQRSRRKRARPAASLPKA